MKHTKKTIPVPVGFRAASCPPGGEIAWPPQLTTHKIFTRRVGTKIPLWFLGLTWLLASLRAELATPHPVASDMTKPELGNDNGSIGDPKFVQIQNGHYWGLPSLNIAAKGLPQPLYLGEDVHLNAYNRLELATDPSLRDIWGEYLLELWDQIWKTKGSLGLSIWAGIDDTFYLRDNQTVGYGSWGVLDGWRRKKPEFWNMRKAYSPVRIRNAENATIRQSTITLEIENRYLFTNLKAVGITWKLGKRTGIATADIPAGKKTHAALSQTSIDFNSQAIPRPTKPPSGTRPQSLLRHPTFTPSNAATVNGKSIDTAGFWSRLPPSPRPDRSS